MNTNPDVAPSDSCKFVIVFFQFSQEPPMNLRQYFLLPIFAAICGGCASNPTPKPAVLSLQSAASGRSFAQKFPQAYFSQADDGDREVVLINDGYVKPVKQVEGPLQPVALVPLEQIMHFKILWNPLPGTHTDAPSTTNALIDWTITSSRPGQTGDSLRYRGAGFVQVDGGYDRLTLTIRNAMIQPTSHTGSLVDPLGNCTLNGSFTALRNDGLVHATVAQLQGEPASPPVEASAEMDPANGGPPTRSPSSP
jgi:hypothetical protein